MHSGMGDKELEQQAGVHMQRQQTAVWMLIGAGLHLKVELIVQL
jgi:hypothetical protein